MLTSLVPHNASSSNPIKKIGYCKLKKMSPVDIVNHYTPEGQNNNSFRPSDTGSRHSPPKITQRPPVHNNLHNRGYRLSSFRSQIRESSPKSEVIPAPVMMPEPDQGAKSGMKSPFGLPSIATFQDYPRRASTSKSEGIAESVMMPEADQGAKSGMKSPFGLPSIGTVQNYPHRESSPKSEVIPAPVMMPEPDQGAKSGMRSPVGLLSTETGSTCSARSSNSGKSSDKALVQELDEMIDLLQRGQQDTLNEMSKYPQAEKRRVTLYFELVQTLDNYAEIIKNKHRCPLTSTLINNFVDKVIDIYDDKNEGENMALSLVSNRLLLKYFTGDNGDRSKLLMPMRIYINDCLAKSVT